MTFDPNRPFVRAKEEQQQERDATPLATLGGEADHPAEVAGQEHFDP